MVGPRNWAHSSLFFLFYCKCLIGSPTTTMDYKNVCPFMPVYHPHHSYILTLNLLLIYISRSTWNFNFSVVLLVAFFWQRTKENLGRDKRTWSWSSIDRVAFASCNKGIYIIKSTRLRKKHICHKKKTRWRGRGPRL